MLANIFKWVFILTSFSASLSKMETVANLEIKKYQGRWYQVYANPFSFFITEKGGSCITADYSIVTNDGIRVVNNELDKNGQPSSIKGYANITDPSQPGQLTVYFNDNNFGAPYWVIDLGPEVDKLYDYSVVSDPKGLGLFVLTRNVERFFQNYNESLSRSLSKQGFRLIPTDQENCPSSIL